MLPESSTNSSWHVDAFGNAKEMSEDVSEDTLQAGDHLAEDLLRHHLPNLACGEVCQALPAADFM